MNDPLTKTLFWRSYSLQVNIYFHYLTPSFNDLTSLFLTSSHKYTPLRKNYPKSTYESQTDIRFALSHVNFESGKKNLPYQFLQQPLHTHKALAEA